MVYWLRIETRAFWRETNVSEQFPITIRFHLQMWNRQKYTTLHAYDVKRRSPWCIILIVPESKSRLSLVTTWKMVTDLITSFVWQLAVWNTRQTLTSSFLKNVLARTNSWFARNWIKKKHTQRHTNKTQVKVNNVDPFWIDKNCKWITNHSCFNCLVRLQKSNKSLYKIRIIS